MTVMDYVVISALALGAFVRFAWPMLRPRPGLSEQARMHLGSEAGMIEAVHRTTGFSGSLVGSALAFRLDKACSLINTGKLPSSVKLVETDASNEFLMQMQLPGGTELQLVVHLDSDKYEAYEANGVSLGETPEVQALLAVLYMQEHAIQASLLNIRLAGEILGTGDYRHEPSVKSCR